MYNLNQYQYRYRSKPQGNKIKKITFQLGIMLIIMLVLILFKYTKNDLGLTINEGFKNLFYTDYTDKAKEALNNVYPYISSNGENLEDAADTTSTESYFTLDYLPVEGPITSEFGARVNPVTKKQENHTGIDIAVKEGTEVKLVYDGIVEKVEDSEATGITLTVDHNNGYKTRYGHLSEVKTSEGEEVKKGTIIGLSGGTGISTGPHLQFEVLYNDEAVNPLDFLKASTD